MVRSLAAGEGRSGIVDIVWVYAAHDAVLCARVAVS